MKENISTEERLEKAIKRHPNNYFVVRSISGELVQVEDFDSGRNYRKVKDEHGIVGWIW